MKRHLGTGKSQVPTIIGMNFQAVSVGQKLIEKSNGVKGGYLNAAGTPSPGLLDELKFVDASVGAFANELKARGLYDTTLIVITAKTASRLAIPAATFHSSSISLHPPPALQGRLHSIFTIHH